MDHPIAPALQILVVEDDPRAGRVLADLLRSDGFAVEVCAGAAGVERVRHGPLPDVLLTGQRVPTREGAAVVRQARGRRSSLPVIVVTAHPQLAPTGGSGPAPLLFIKPLDYHALLATLTDLQAARDGDVSPLD